MLRVRVRVRAAVRHGAWPVVEVTAVMAVVGVVEAVAVRASGFAHW